ncbi:MAG: glutamate-cysteine ligase family protein [Coriobacteriia bacterium]|nr:glutamate-cysteine ligase family protein [Coriobacteriia bacterium]
MDDRIVDLSVDPSHVSAISDYIARGIDHGCGDCIGLELEHFIVRRDDHTFVPYEDDFASGLPGVRSVLERLAPYYDQTILETQVDGTRNLIGLSREYASITIEPGAQFEISIGPVLEVGDLEIVYQRFRNELDPLLEELGLMLLELGYHPSARAGDIPLIPKNRYHFMDEHFRDTGRHGICMMRATASTQVSIDYDSEEDAVRKFRIANALTPLFAFITDNSPVFELAPVGSEGLTTSGLAVPARMVRTAIWNDVDPARSLTAPHTFGACFGFDSYAHAVLSAPGIFTVEENNLGEKRSIQQKGKSFAEIFAGCELDRASIEHILSLFFFDVRFKTYIEIRAADSLPIAYALSFAAFIKGLFYNTGTVADLSSRFECLSAEDIASAKRELCARGFAAEVYGRTAVEWLDELLGLSLRSLPPLESRYLDPLGELITSRMTLLDKKLEEVSE